ncbi:uncharacterized protein MONBRDRAFT_23890, partial [Monosiga brevicollis MX1]
MQIGKLVQFPCFVSLSALMMIKRMRMDESRLRRGTKVPWLLVLVMALGLMVAVVPGVSAAVGTQGMRQEESVDCRRVAETLMYAAALQPETAKMWQWAYGQGIMMSTGLDLAQHYGWTNWTTFFNQLLDGFEETPGQVANSVLNNITMAFDHAVGDRIGLFPIAYLTRQSYGFGNANDAVVIRGIIDEYILPYPYRLNDTARCFSRFEGWSGQVSNGPSFVWADDQFMGLTVLSRYAKATQSNDFVSMAAHMQLTYA